MSFWTRKEPRGSVKTTSEGSEQGKPAEITMDPRESNSHKSESGNISLLQLGSLVPDFSAKSTQGKMEWHRWIDDGWAVLFSQPGEFTPACTTELAVLAKLEPEFSKRNIKVAVVSSSPYELQLDWTHDIEQSDISEGSPITFPIISDTDRSIALAYGILDVRVKAENEMPVPCRAVLLIGPEKRLEMSMLYPVSTGRNFAELLRVIDAFLLSKNHGVHTPVNWVPGEKCCVPVEMDDEQAKEKFGRINAISMPSGKNYMRLVADPSGLAKKAFSWGGFFRSVLGVGSGAVLGLLAGKYVKPLKDKLQ